MPTEISLELLPLRYRFLFHCVRWILYLAIISDLINAWFVYFSTKQGMDLLGAQNGLSIPFLTLITVGDFVTNACLITPTKEAFEFTSSLTGPDQQLTNKTQRIVIIMFKILALPYAVCISLVDALALNDFEQRWPTDHSQIFVDICMIFFTLLGIAYFFATSGADLGKHVASIFFNFSDSAINQLWKQHKLLTFYAGLLGIISILYLGISTAWITGKAVELFGHADDSSSVIGMEIFAFLITFIVMIFSYFMAPFEFFLHPYKEINIHNQDRKNIHANLSPSEKLILYLQSMLIPTIFVVAINYVNLALNPFNSIYINLAVGMTISLLIFLFTFSAEMTHQLNKKIADNTNNHPALEKTSIGPVTVNLCSQIAKTIQAVTFCDSLGQKYITALQGRKDITISIGLFFGTIISVLTFMYYHPKLMQNKSSLIEPWRLMRCQNNNSAENTPLLPGQSSKSIYSRVSNCVMCFFRRPATVAEETSPTIAYPSIA